MKNLFSLIVLIFLFYQSNLYSQTYIYDLRNDSVVSDRIYEFDIYLLRTGVVELELAATQFGFSFNPAIKNGGTISWSIVNGTSTLSNTSQIPSAFSVDNTNNILRIAAKVPPGPGSGSIISNSGFGTRICRVRISNTAPFTTTNPNISWNFNSTGGRYPSRIFAYIGGLNTDITTQPNHILNLNNTPLPVSLSNFKIQIISKNDVQINWSTLFEQNNFGFKIERKNEKSEWSVVGFKEGALNSNIPKDYSFIERNLNTGKYFYRLNQIDVNGNNEYFYYDQPVEVAKPQKFNVSQNYPNPFNPNTSIDFEISEESDLEMLIYDVSGRLIKQIKAGLYKPGYYTEKVTLDGFSSGVYIYIVRFKSSKKEFSIAKKMLLLK